MDVYLKVLEGAKSGGTIAIKKDRFLIGRSRKCHLCASSNAISRRHCVITRQDASVTIQDLGSRNGTLVNGNRIEQEVEIHSGDELGVGPLRFMLTISHGISNLKRPKAQSVAEVADRTVDTHHSNVQEEDISSWLLGTEPIQSMTETQTIRLDDTNATEMKQVMTQPVVPPVASESTGDAPTGSPSSSQQPITEAPEEEPETVDSDVPSKSNKGMDSKIFKKRKGPGKLPHLPHKPATKDSREAATEALRSWGRRG